MKVEATGVVSLIIGLVVAIVRFFYKIEKIEERRCRDHQILQGVEKRLSKMEKFLIKKHDFDKDTDSGIFPRDDR